MLLNINHEVKVKLTQRGRDAYRMNHQQFWQFVNHANPPQYVAPVEDDNGWSTWQLWELMNLFGAYVQMGIDPVFETTIEIIEGQT